MLVRSCLLSLQQWTDKSNLVKKIRLRATQTRKDDKIFREVNTLSRLNHRFIVRYFTTWIEASEPVSAVPSDSDTEDDSSDKTASASVSGSSSLRTTRHDGDSEDSFGDPLHVNLDELGGGSYSKGSFPSIHFGNADKDGSSDDESLSEEEDNMPIFKIDGVGSDTSPKLDIPSPRPLMRTLYIQMVRSIPVFVISIF
jgi:eukaryotic translation initiation factor 2-alpha kinase 4